MKNNILIAMGIGIVAALSVNATSLRTLAEDSVPEPVTPEGGNGTPATDTTENQSSAMTEAVEHAQQIETQVEEAVQKAQDVITETRTIPELQVLPDLQNKAGDLEAELTDGDWVDDYKKAAGIPKKTDLSSMHQDDAVDAQEAMNAITDETKGNLALMDGVDTQAAAAANLVQNKANEVNASVDKADALEKKANDLVGIQQGNGTEPDPDPALIKTLKEADKTLDEASATILGATDRPTAEAAMNGAQEAVNNADQKVKEAEAGLTTIEGEFKKAETAYTADKKEYDQKVLELDSLLRNYEELKKKAGADAKAEEAELNRLMKEADKVRGSADTQYTESTQDGLAVIAALEKKLKDNNGKNKYDDYRKLAWAIMKYYYVPEMLGGEVITTYDELNQGWATDDNSALKYTDENGNTYKSTGGDVLRYGVIRYTKNGQEYSLNINYKTSVGNKFNSDDYNGIVIFEKTKHVAVDGKDLPGTVVNLLDTEGRYEDADTGFTYIKYDGQYYRLDGSGDTSEFEAPQGDNVTDPSGLEVGSTYKKVNEENKRTSYEMIDGRLTLVEKADYRIQDFVVEEINGEKVSRLSEETDMKDYVYRKTVYGERSKIGQIQLRNDNWYSGKILLAEYDYAGNAYTTDGREGASTASVTVNPDDNNDFRTKVDGVLSIIEKYAKLSTDAKATKKALQDARDEVKKLEVEIANLKCDHKAATVKEFKASLKKAQDTLKDAKDLRDGLTKKLDELKDLYTEKIADLPVPGPASDADTSAGDTPVSGPVSDASVAAPLVNAPLPVNAVLGANRPLQEQAVSEAASEQNGTNRGVLGKRRGMQGEVLGMKRSPKTADGAAGGMVAGMVMSILSAFGGAAALKKKRRDEEENR